MSTQSPLSEAEERELDRSLADVQRYPLQINAEQWQQLRDLAKIGDRRGQLALLRPTMRAGATDPGVGFGSAGDPVPAIVQDLLDRLQTAEQRATVAEERVRQLEAGM